MIFHVLQLVFDGEFFLFHALDTQLITADCHHGIDGCIEIRVFLFQTCDGQSDFGLFLIGHAVCPVLFRIRLRAVPARPSAAQTRFERSPYHIFRDWKMLPRQIRLSTSLMPKCHGSVMGGCQRAAVHDSRDCVTGPKKQEYFGYLRSVSG